MIGGLVDALAGLRKARKPAAWDAFQARLDTPADANLAAQVRELNVLFGDGRALDEVKRLALDEKAELETRKAALRTLIDSRPSDLRSICERLVRVRYLNAVAVRGLALFDDPEIGQSLARNYRSFHPSDRPAALEVMVSRPSFARALLDQVAAGRIARGDLTAFHARQIRSLGDRGIDRTAFVGVGRDPRTRNADRRDRISQLKQKLDRATLAPGRPGPRTVGLRPGLRHVPQALRSRRRDRSRPDRLGSRQSGLPAGEHRRPQCHRQCRLPDGRRRDARRPRVERPGQGSSPSSLTLQTQTEAIALDRAEIEASAPVTVILMPDGLLETLTQPEIRDLIAYLAHPTQVPLPPAPGGNAGGSPENK